MANFTKTTITDAPRTELHDALKLTGAEISINTLPAKASVPFIHYHKQNEEIYGILEGSGKVILDGETFALAKGDWLRIAPATHRQFFAAEDSDLRYICIQVKENSLENFTASDAEIIQ